MSARHRAVMQCPESYCGAWHDNDEVFEYESCPECGAAMVRRTEADLDELLAEENSR